MKSREPLALLIIVGISIFVSAIHPYDGLTWLLEVSLVLITAPVRCYVPQLPAHPAPLPAHFHSFADPHHRGPLHLCARPLGTWAQDFSILRGTTMAGSATLRRIRPSDGRTGDTAPELAAALRQVALFSRVCFCLAFSAFYEFIEWWTAVIIGQAATDFLGTQGDVWDTKWDMFMAFAGAITAQLTLSRLHDRELDSLETTETPARAAKI